MQRIVIVTRNCYVIPLLADVPSATVELSNLCLMMAPDCGGLRVKKVVIPSDRLPLACYVLADLVSHVSIPFGLAWIAMSGRQLIGSLLVSGANDANCYTAVAMFTINPPLRVAGVAIAIG